MIICEECKKEFKSLKSLGQHLANPLTKVNHYPTTKEYYDKFLKTGNEGICKIDGCNKDTSFIGLVKGYLKYCSHECYNLDPEIINIRIESNKNRIDSKETREKMSNSKKKNWEDPNYIMRDSEIQKRKGEKMKINRADPNSKFNNGEWSEKMSQSMKKLWEDPDCFWRSNKFLDQVVLGRKNRMINGLASYANSKKTPESFKKQSESMIKFHKEHPEFKEKQRQLMIDGLAVHAQSFIQNPSKPQVELYIRIKELYPSAILNYPFYRGEGKRNYSLDVAIPELKICFESDGSWYHQDVDHDLKREEEIKELGWKIIRYKADCIKDVPLKEQIKNDIEKIT